MVTQLHTPVPITTVEGKNEDNKVTWLLEYYIQTHQCKNDEERFGVRIVRTHPDSTYDCEAQSIAVFDNYDEAMALLGYLAKGAVRPHNLDDFVEEWFAEKAIGRGIATPVAQDPEWYTHHDGA